MQVIQDSNAGGRIGASLSNALQQLAQNKIQELQGKHAHLQKVQSYQGLGFNPQESHAIAGLPDKLQQLLVPAYLERVGNSQGETGMEYMQQQMEPAVKAESHIPAAARGTAQFQQQPFQANPLENVLQSIMQRGQPQQQVQAAPIVQQQEAAKAVAPALSKAERIAQHQAKRPSIAEVLARPTAKELAAQRKQTLEEQARVDKQLKPFVDKIAQEKEQADFSAPRLNEMKKLVKRGKLPSAAEYKILKSLEDLSPLSGAGAGAAAGGALGAFGGPVGAAFGTTAGAAIGAGVGAMISPVATILHNLNKSTFATDEERFEKLTASFLAGAKNVFGGRFTEKEMAAYLAGLPNLAQTDKGKLDVIEDMELFNKAANIKYKAMRQIVHENGGRIPANLPELIEQRVKPQLDRISDIFREDIPSF